MTKISVRSLKKLIKEAIQNPLHEADELQHSPTNKIVTIKEAAKLVPSFWNCLIEEVEIIIGYNELYDLGSSPSDHRMYDGIDLCLESRVAVKKHLKEILNKKCIVTSDGKVIMLEGTMYNSTSNPEYLREISHGTVDMFFAEDCNDDNLKQNIATLVEQHYE